MGRRGHQDDRRLSAKQKARILRELIKVSPQLIRAIAFLAVTLSMLWISLR